MTVQKRERNAVPVYLIGLVWLVGIFALGVNTLAGYVGTALASACAFFVGRAIFPDRLVEVQAPDPAPADPEEAALQQERARAVGELHRLNDSIEDEEISRCLFHMEETTGKIFDQVMANPAKRSAVGRFMDYYLPTTIKLLNQYDRMDQLGTSGENVTAAKERVRSVLGTVSAAFDKQLDALFQDEYMDMSAEITVLEQMLRREGWTEQEFHTGPAGM